jgi:predicted nucleic acid-binding protein
MIKSPFKIVCDSGPIIHLDELNCLRLLEDFQEILLPGTVYEEIKRHRPSRLNDLNLPFVLSAGIVPKNSTLITLCRIFSLDAGETEALGLMEKNPEAIFLTDDASARMVAEQMGFKVHGTIGILVRSIRRNQMESGEVLRTLRSIPSRSTLYLKPSLLDEVILKIKKEYNL